MNQFFEIFLSILEAITTYFLFVYICVCVYVYVKFINVHTHTCIFINWEVIIIGVIKMKFRWWLSVSTFWLKSLLLEALYVRLITFLPR